MDLIDEDGNLLGAVNVVDALAVLLVLAVVVAGAALVFGSGGDEGPDVDSTYVTLDLGQQPTYIVSAINAGDVYEAGSNSQLTLTDVYLTPQNDGTRVVVRAEVRGPVSDDGDGFSYADAPLRLGRTLDIATNRYQLSGQIRSVGQSETLSRTQTTVVLRDTMAAADTREVTSGDEIAIAGKRVAEIDDVAVYSTDDPTEHVVFAQATVQSYTQQGEQRFGGSPVRRGQTIRLPTESYTLAGRIERVGVGLDRSQADIVLEDTVTTQTAAQLTEGDTATVAGGNTARIERVTTYATQNPDRKRVVIGASLQTLGYGERERFGLVPVQPGNAITLETGEVSLSGTIDRVGTTEPPGAVATRSVTLRMEPVRQEMADAIRPGMTERSGNETIARVTDVSVEPSVIIATGDNGSVNVVDHPFNREVLITTDLRVRETINGVHFKGQSLRQGQTVSIDLGTVVVRATVVRVGV